MHGPPGQAVERRRDKDGESCVSLGTCDSHLLPAPHTYPHNPNGILTGNPLTSGFCTYCSLYLERCPHIPQASHLYREVAWPTEKGECGRACAARISQPRPFMLGLGDGVYCHRIKGAEFQGYLAGMRVITGLQNLGDISEWTVTLLPPPSPKPVPWEQLERPMLSCPSWSLIHN